jgi:site-specific DNA-cytosine methylase
VPGLPYQGGSGNRDTADQETEGVQDLRRDVHALPFQEAQHLQPRVFIPGWKDQRFQEMAQHWSSEPDVPRVAHGVAKRVDRLRGLGNAIVPQIAEWIAQRILEAEGR